MGSCPVVVDGTVACPLIKLYQLKAQPATHLVNSLKHCLGSVLVKVSGLMAAADAWCRPVIQGHSLVSVVALQAVLVDIVKRPSEISALPVGCGFEHFLRCEI